MIFQKSFIEFYGVGNKKVIYKRLHYNRTNRLNKTINRIGQVKQILLKRDYVSIFELIFLIQ